MKDKIENAATKIRSTAGNAKDTVITAIDVNGDGTVDIEDVITLGLRVPGIKIKREDFLKRELLRRFPEEVVQDAVLHNPAHAMIPKEIIDEIADSVIEYERKCVSGISAALGTPGGFAMVATIPTDIAQYYGYMLRATQKLMYLYGFPEIDVNENGAQLDSEIMNTLIICLGTMYGVQGANNALKTVAKALGQGVEKKLLNAALTKGTLYPIVKETAKWFGAKMTKEIFAGFFKKAIPVVGGVLGGGITYISFKPCCKKLKDTLKDTKLSNPNWQDDGEADIIETEFNEI